MRLLTGNDQKASRASSGIELAENFNATPVDKSVPGPQGIEFSNRNTPSVCSIQDPGILAGAPGRSSGGAPLELDAIGIELHYGIKMP